MCICVQVIHRANDVEYGLCACVWSENSGITHRVAQALDVSIAQYSKIFCVALVHGYIIQIIEVLREVR